MEKTWIIVYDQVFASLVVYEITTLLILNGREQINIGEVDIISQDHWWFGEYWGED